MGTKISAMIAVTAGNLDDTALFETTDKTVATRKATVAQLRVAIAAAAIAFLSTVSVAGAMTVGGTITTSGGGGTQVSIPSGDIQMVSDAGYGILSANATRVLSINNTGIALSNLTVSGATTLTGTLGIGTAPISAQGIRLAGTLITATTTPAGIAVFPTFDSSSTVYGANYYCSFVTAAGAWTMTSGYGVLVDSPTISNTAVTSLYGVYVFNQGQAKSTSAYGIFIAAQSGAVTNNYAIYSAGGLWNQADATQSTTTATGSIVTAGGLGVAKDAFFGGKITTLGGATFHTTSSALTTGAGAGAGTITNAPTAGNPTKWVGINDNGTTRYIPAW